MSNSISSVLYTGFQKIKSVKDASLDTGKKLNSSLYAINPFRLLNGESSEVLQNVKSTLYSANEAIYTVNPFRIAHKTAKKFSNFVCSHPLLASGTGVLLLANPVSSDPQLQACLQDSDGHLAAYFHDPDGMPFDFPGLLQTGCFLLTNFTNCFTNNGTLLTVFKIFGFGIHGDCKKHSTWGGVYSALPNYTDPQPFQFSDPQTWDTTIQLLSPDKLVEYCLKAQGFKPNTNDGSSVPDCSSLSTTTILAAVFGSLGVSVCVFGGCFLYIKYQNFKDHRKYRPLLEATPTSSEDPSAPFNYNANNTSTAITIDPPKSVQNFDANTKDNFNLGLP